ncbi:MAG: CBS domain-containing protein, partial [Nitrospinota bacterium]
VSGAPISTILILFEMTGDYKIILPLMITCIVSTYMVRIILKESIYSLKLKRRGIDIDKNTGIDLMEVLKVSDATIKEVIVVNESSTVRKAGLKSKSSRHRGFPIVNDAGELTGIISYKDINNALSTDRAEVSVKEVMTTDVITCYADETLRAAIEKLGKKNIGRMPVVDSDDPTKLIGLISRKSILKSFKKELQARGDSNRSED